MIKLSDFIAKYLKEKHGIEHFFLVSGGGAMHLNDSFGRYLSYTACHHEQACAYAAEGYARVNQRLALVNPTTGPGGLNCLSGVLGQWTDSVPVLYVSGQVKTQTCTTSCPELNLRQLGDQEVDIIQVVKHLTKYAVQIRDPKEIKYHIDKAVYEATTGRFGPVWLDIPHDVQASLIDENDLVEFVQPQKNSNTHLAHDIDAIIAKLQSANRPLIIAGHGIRLSRQLQNFKSFLQECKIPVVTTFNGFDIMEDADALYVGRIGTVGQRAGNFALQSADFILCLGTRNNIRQVSYNWENYAKNAYIVAVDIDNAELNKPTVKPHLLVSADLNIVIPALLNHIKKRSFEAPEVWKAHCAELKDSFNFAARSDQVQTQEIIEPYHFTYALTKAMRENDIFIMANGSACVCSFQNAIVKHGQRYILNSGNAAMGFALPAAIGACYEAKGRNVICLEGDGSIMMNVQELQTIKHNNLPIKIFIINNNGYTSIKQTQKNFFGGNMVGSEPNSGVSFPNFVELAKAFGVEAVQTSNPLTMEPEIKDVLAQKNAVVCSVTTISDYDFMPKLSARKLDDGTMVSPSLEDMYPFLEREEFERW